MSAESGLFWDKIWLRIGRFASEEKFSASLSSHETNRLNTSLSFRNTTTTTFITPSRLVEVAPCQQIRFKLVAEVGPTLLNV